MKRCDSHAIRIMITRMSECISLPPDELKERNYCLVPNNRAIGQKIGSKRAVSFEQCANDCKFFDECNRASYESCFGTCDFYR